MDRDVVVSVISINISIIVSFMCTDYTTEAWKGKLKKPGKPQLLIAVSNIIIIILYVVFLGMEHDNIELHTLLQRLCKQVIIPVLIVTLVSLFASYILVGRKSVLNGKDLDKNYVKFTRNSATANTIYIISGDFDFLGRIPKDDRQCISTIQKSKDTDDHICRKANKKSEKCQKCPMLKPQFIQFLDISMEGHMGLWILCRRPELDEDDYKIMIGFIQRFFSNAKIRFYSDEDGKCPKLPLRGRIIKDANQNHKMLSHYVKGQGIYITETHSDNETAKGKTLIGLYMAIWESADSDDELVSNCRHMYEELLSSDKEK